MTNYPNSSCTLTDLDGDLLDEVDDRVHGLGHHILGADNLHDTVARLGTAIREHLDKKTQH